jgi:hypothetical protein
VVRVRVTTMGNLRVALTVGFVLGCVAIWLAAEPLGWSGGPVVAAIGAAVLLFFPTVLVRRIDGDTPLARLGLTTWCVLILVLALVAMAALPRLPLVTAAAVVAMVVACWQLQQRARAAIERDPGMLLAPGGDTDFGVYTALTPMLKPPSSQPQDAEQTSSLYDPEGGRDRIPGGTRPVQQPHPRSGEPGGADEAR